MTYSYNTPSENSNGQNQNVSETNYVETDPVVQEVTESDESTDTSTETTSETFVQPSNAYQVAPAQGDDTTTGIGIIDSYYCNTDEESDLSDITDKEIYDAYFQSFSPGRESNTFKGMNPDGSIDLVKGEHNPDNQFEKAPCLNFPYKTGWDYVDYVPRPENQKGALGDGVTRLLTIPGGPPKGYGNISHNPISYEQTTNEIDIMYHMDGRKWNHIERGAAGVQDSIKHTTDWESGVAYTATNANTAIKQPGIHTTAGGSGSKVTKLGNDVRYGKWRSKDNNKGNNLTDNAILLGHVNKPNFDSTQNFGVVGISGFINAHVSDIMSPKKGHSTEFCRWSLNHIYGMYRFDSSDDELEERSDNAYALVDEFKEILEQILDNVSQEESYLAEEGRTASLSNQNFATQLLDNGTFDRLNNYKIRNEKDGSSQIIAAICEMTCTLLPVNDGVPEEDHDFPVTGEFILELLQLRGQITMADLLSYMWSRLFGVPEAALRLLGRTIDLEGLARYTRDEVRDHIQLHRFVVWAFVNKNAANIHPVSFDEGEYVITMENGLTITYAEFVNYYDWGWESICESNNGSIIMGDNVDRYGRNFYNEKLCVDEEIYNDTGESIEIMDRLHLVNKITIGDYDPEIDEFDEFNILQENRFIPNVTSLRNSLTRGGAIQWPTDEEIRSMTKFSTVNAVRGVRAGQKPDWDGWPDHIKDAITLEFKPGEVYKMYEWINRPFTNENGEYVKGKPAFEFWSAPTKDAKGTGNVNGWLKVGGIGNLQPNNIPKQGRPQGQKQENPERSYLRVVALCPSNVAQQGGNKCNKFMNALGWDDPAFRDDVYDTIGNLHGEYQYPVMTFNLKIFPARKNDSGNAIDNENEGPCYHAEDITGNNQPIPDFTNVYWDQPLRRVQATTSTGIRNIKRGSTYEIKLVHEQGDLIATHDVYPEFHLIWGRDRDSLSPNAPGVDQRGLYTYNGQFIPQATQQFNPPPLIVEAESDYLFFGCTKSGRTIDQWSITGESWLIIKEVPGGIAKGPAYYSENQNPYFRQENIINIEENKWTEPLTTYTSDDGYLKTGGIYTIKRNNQNSTGDYRVIFANNVNALRPKTYQIKNASMFSSNDFYDTGITLSRADASRTYTFSAPSPYMILCAANNDPKDGNARSVANWNAGGEPAGIDGEGITLTYVPTSAQTFGPAFWALNQNFDNPQGIDLNRNNNHAPFYLKSGYVDFNNNYWSKPFSSKSIVTQSFDTAPDGSGAAGPTYPIIPGRTYNIQILEVGGSMNDFEGRLGASYRVNWLTDDRFSPNPALALGNPSEDDQRSWNRYYAVSDGDDEIVKPNSGSVDNSINVVAKGSGFVLGLCALPDPTMEVLQREWPTQGHQLQVIVKEVNPIVEHPGYPAYGDMSNLHHPGQPGTPNKTGEIPFTWEVYQDVFNLPWNTYRQNGLRFKKGDVLEVKWHTEPGETRHNYDLTFWWLNADAVQNSPLPAKKTYNASLDDHGRYVTLKYANTEGVKIVCRDEYLVLGIVDHFNKPGQKPYYNYNADGTKVHILINSTGETEDPDQTNDKVGASYYADGEPNNLPQVWDTKFTEPLTAINGHRTVFVEDDGREVNYTFTPGNKYRFGISPESNHSARIFFIKDGAQYLSPKANNIDATNIFGNGGFIDTGKDLAPGNNGILECYMPANTRRMIMGAFDVSPDPVTGDALTFANWSPVGEPLDNDTSYDVGVDRFLTVSDVTPDDPGFLRGPMIHASYSGGVTNINAGYDNTPSVLLESGEVNFFNEFWEPFDMVTEFIDENGDRQTFQEGTYYDIKFQEDPNNETFFDPDVIVNWMRGTSAANPNTNIGNGYQDRIVNYRINGEVREEITLRRQKGWVTLECLGRGFVFGAFNFKNALNTDPYNYLKWSPGGHRCMFEVRVTPNNEDLIEGPAYLADGLVHSNVRDFPDFTDDYWELPFNTFEQRNLLFEVNRNYRVKFDLTHDDQGRPDDTEYTFFWCNRKGIETNDLADNTGFTDRIISRDTRQNVIKLTHQNLADGVVVKCLNPYLVLGTNPNYRIGENPVVDEWPANGGPAHLFFELTDDPITEMEVIEGPAYFAGDDTTYRLPSLADPHYAEPLRFISTDKNNVRIEKGFKLRVKAKEDCDHDLKIIFLGTPEAETPKGSGLDPNELFDGGHYIDTGVELFKSQPNVVKEFYAPSDRFLFSAWNSKNLITEDGTEILRELSNWSPYGEPAGLDESFPNPDDGFEVEIITNNHEEVGEAYWADEVEVLENAGNPAGDRTLAKGEINFFDEHWHPHFNVFRQTTPLDQNDQPEDIVDDQLYRITVTHAAGFEYGGTVTINWVRDPGLNTPLNTATNLARDYDNYYASTESLPIGSTFEVYSRSDKFCVGISDLTNVPGNVANSVYSWSPRGLPINVQIEKVEKIEGPAYFADGNGVVDWANSHWNKPFNNLTGARAPYRPNTTYRVAPTRDEQGNKVYTGLDYYFYAVTRQGLTGNNVTNQFELLRDEDGDVAVFRDREPSGNIATNVIEFVTPADDNFKYFVLGARDPYDQTAVITDWSQDGQPADINIKITERDPNDDTPKGPGYYGSVDDVNTLTDFSNPHWEVIHHWNISPQNTDADDQTQVTYFERGGSYRVTRIPNETAHEYELYGARTDAALEVGNDHRPQFFNYGQLLDDIGTLDIKDVDFENIVFCSINTNPQITLDEWSPQGEPVMVKVKDLTDMVTAHGPAYFAGYNVNNPVDHISTGHFLSNLNTFDAPPNTDQLVVGERYAVTFGPSLKGIARCVFAKDVESLNANHSNSEYIFDDHDTDTHGRTYPIVAESEQLLFQQWNVPGKTQINDWSIDGEPIDVHITKIDIPGRDENGNILKGPAYYGDDNANHKPDFTNKWWKKPLNPLNGPNAFVVGREYTLKAGAGLKYKYKVWYGSAETMNPDENSVFKHNNETFGAGDTIKITALETNVYLAAYQTDRKSYRDWGWDGEPADVTVTTGDDNRKRGPGYFGSENEDFTKPDFSNPHWERVFHWNASPQVINDQNAVRIETGKDYRFRIVKVLNETKTKYDYDIYGAMNNGALEVGANHNGDLDYIESFRLVDEYVDVKMIPYDRIVFSAVMLGGDAVLEDWSPEGDTVFLDVENVPIDQEPDPNNPGRQRDVRGPAYFTEKNKDPDWANIIWSKSLNYFDANLVTEKVYEVTGDPQLQGTLKVYFARNKEALDTRNFNARDFVFSGAEISANKKVLVRAPSPYMIFGHYNKPGKTLNNWGRDGEPAQVKVVPYGENTIKGPAYYAEDNPEHEPEWLDDYWDTPLNSVVPKLVKKGEFYQIEALITMDANIRYKLWFGNTNRPDAGSKFTTNNDVIKKGDKLVFQCLDDYLYLGAFNTGKNDKSEWSRKGEPAEIHIVKVNPKVIEGPGYFGSKTNTSQIPKFSDPHWEEFHHYNSFERQTYFEKGGYYRVHFEPGTTQEEYTIYGARRKEATLLGNAHINDFHDYGQLKSSLEYVDIKDMQFTTVIFSALNQVNKNLTDWSPTGEPVDVTVEQLVDDDDRLPDGRYDSGPVYYQSNATSKPNWKSSRWIGPLNYQRGCVAGKRYKITLDSNLPVSLYFADSIESLDPRTNKGFTDTGKRLATAGSYVTVDATSDYLIFGGYNWPNMGFNDWGRDGEPVRVTIEEVTFDETVFGPLYWADNALLDAPLTDPHFTKPLNQYPNNQFKRNFYYKVTRAAGEHNNYDISFIFSDDRDHANPNATTQYEISPVVFKKTDTEIELKTLGKYLYLGASKLPGGHPARNDYKMWSPTGEPYKLNFELIDYDEGPEYWADENVTPSNWKKGLPYFKDHYWLSPINFVERISANQEYEVKVPRGTRAIYDYYIWETSVRNISQTTKASDFKLLGEIKQYSTESISIKTTKSNVVIGVRNTGVLRNDWSPIGAPTVLEFTKLASGRRGISYFADDKVGTGVGAQQEYEIDWDNPKWKEPGNFRCASPQGTNFNTNREYKISLKEKRNPKYVYTIWTVLPAVGDKPGGGRAGRAHQGNITLNRKKGAPKFQKIYPIYGKLLLAAHDFNGENRNLVNWSKDGERVDLKIKATGDQAVEIPWGPIMGAIIEALKYLLALLGLIFLLIGVAKPEHYLVNFDNSVGEDEVPCVGNKDHWSPYGKVGHQHLASNATPLFINKVADKDSRFLIRWMYLRFHGYMINARNVSGVQTGTGEDHWFLNIGFHNVAATHQVGFVKMGDDKVRILPFAQRRELGEKAHTRRNKNDKGDGKTMDYVGPRRLVTGEDDLKAQYNWDESKRWFNISAAYGVRSPNEGNYNILDYWDLAKVNDNNWRKAPRTTITEGFAKTHDNSQKAKNNDISAVPVDTDGSKWLTSYHHVDNIFNGQGWKAYFTYTHGKTNSKDHRAFHYVLGVEGPEFGPANRDGYAFWPVRPADSINPDDPFYLGMSFDLRDPKLGTYGSSDWQIAYLRLVFKNTATHKDWTQYIDLPNLDKTYTYVREEHWSYGDNDGNSNYPIAHWANVYDMFPSSKTKLLFRNSTGPADSADDMYHQVEGNLLRVTVVSNRLFYPKQFDGQNHLTSIMLGICKGNSNTKTYDYSFEIANLKPLAFADRPEYIGNRRDYDHYFPPAPPEDS